MKRWRLFVAASVLVAVTLAAVVALFGPPHRWLVALGLAYPSAEECALVLAWVGTQGVHPGTERALALPGELGWASRESTVHASRATNGRVCVLLKRSIGWKENFTGTLACDAPLAGTEVIGASAASAPYVELESSTFFRELYVAESVAAGLYRVYFDLN